jgi:uncharacterized protein DUF1842
MATQQTGLFPVSYEIGGDKPGAPRFVAHLLVYTPAKTVNGTGLITQAINPPLEEATVLHGDFTYMTVMPKITHILITATGYPVVKMPAHGGIGPVLQPNVHLRMVLDGDWKSGTANYSYFANGVWHEIENAPVNLIAVKSVAA